MAKATLESILAEVKKSNSKIDALSKQVKQLEIKVEKVLKFVPIDNADFKPKVSHISTARVGLAAKAK